MGLFHRSVKREAEEEWGKGNLFIEHVTRQALMLTHVAVGCMDARNGTISVGRSKKRRSLVQNYSDLGLCFC
jgi:hypothetical protein